MQTPTLPFIITALSESGADNLPRSSSLPFQKISFKIFILLGCLLLSGAVLAQTTYYVKTSGSDANDGKSWAAAFQTVQQSLSAAISGDQIWVAEGIYYPTADASGSTNPVNSRSKTFVMKNGVAIYGGFAGAETQLTQRNWKMHVTTLSGDLNGDDVVSGSGNTLSISNNSENSYHVIENYQNGLNSTAMLDGFTITGGNANIYGNPNDSGGGMFNYNSSPTLTNCSFSTNSSQFFGGGISNYYSSPTLTNCNFSGNISFDTGGGIFDFNSSPTLTDCSFLGNSAPNFRGGAIYNENCNPILTNCSFVRNTASAGAGIYNYDNSSPILTNCSFSGNSATWDGGGIYNNQSFPILINCSFSGNSALPNFGGGIFNYSISSPTLTNCILWGNPGGEISGSTSATVTYSIVQGGYSGTGNLSQDPMFVDAASDKLRLQVGSPAIDAGDDAANSTTIDLDGNSRKVDAIAGGSQIDIGAYEFQNDGPTIVYVKTNASGANNGMSWTNAYTSLQDALAAAGSGATNVQIWVATGTYKPYADAFGNTSPLDARTKTFMMKNGVAIYGGFDGTESELSKRDWKNNVTILSGDIGTAGDNSDNSYHVIYNYNNNLDNSTVLDGFTITDGNANASNFDQLGGGVFNWNSSPAFANCSFWNNGGSYGGGMYNAFSSPRLTNCSFSGNAALGDLGYGGGMFNDNSSSPSVTNCSFSSNSSNYGGDVHLFFFFFYADQLQLFWQ